MNSSSSGRGACLNHIGQRLSFVDSVFLPVIWVASMHNGGPFVYIYIYIYCGFVLFRVGFLWLLPGFMWLLWLFISHPLHSQFLSAWLLRRFIGFMRLLRLWLFASFALPVPLRQVAFCLCGLWRLSGLGFLRPQHRQFLSGAPPPPFD